MTKHPTPATGLRRHLRPEQRADQRQRETTRAELHAIVDRVIDAWPEAARVANDMVRGYPATSMGGVGGSEGTLVERVALGDAPDPGRWAGEALAHLHEFRGHARTLDREMRAVVAACVDLEQGRVNTVDVCALCKLPAPKVRRIDGQPYCATSCYFRVYRAQRTG